MAPQNENGFTFQNNRIDRNVECNRPIHNKSKSQALNSSVYNVNIINRIS